MVICFFFFWRFDTPLIVTRDIALASLIGM